MNNKKLVKIILYLALAIIILQILFFLYKSAVFMKKHFFTKNTKPQTMKKYGENSYVLITGASSGQGKYFAIHLAELGFNLILVGSIRTQNTIITGSKPMMTRGILRKRVPVKCFVHGCRAATSKDILSEEWCVL